VTENQTTPPEVNAPEANTVPELTELPFLGQALVENADPTFKAYGELVTKLNAGDNVDAMVKDAVANSTEDEVVKLRATIDRAEKAAAKAREQAEALVKPTLEVPTDEQIAEMTTKLKGLDADIRGYNLVFANALAQSDEFKGSDLTLESYLGALPKRKGRSSAATGTGPSRPRVIVEYAYGDSDEFKFAGPDKDKSSFSALAMVLKKDISGYAVSASDFIPAWNTQNDKPETADWQDHDEVSNFTWTANDDKGKTHTVKVRVTKKS